MPPSKSSFIANLNNGKLFYFLNSQFVSTEPHFHLCLHVSANKVVFMLCGTSRPESTTRYLDYNSISYETFVPVKPDPSINQLTKDTYFHCNRVFEFSVEELYNLHISNTFRDKGSIAEHELLNVKNGIIASPILEQDLINDIIKSFPDF